MKQLSGRSTYSTWETYVKFYRRLYKYIKSGKFWRFTGRKRKMLFDRLTRFENKFDLARYSIPAVSTLLFLANKEAKGEAVRMPADIISGTSEDFKLENLDNTTVSYYAKIGTQVGIISGGSGAPYTIDTNVGDNRYFTIRNGNELILNANISKLNRSSFNIEVLDNLSNVVATVPQITVIDIPTNSVAAADIAFKPAAQTLRSGSNSRKAEAADIDNDGDLDLVVLQDTAFTIYYNDGTGYFETVRDFNTLGGTLYTNTSFDLGDVDGDNDLDIFITGNFGLLAEPYPLFINNGGSFTSSLFPASFFDGEAQFADFDRDGDLDIIRFPDFGGNADIYENDGTGTFTVSGTNPAVSGRRIFGLNDLDGDLFIDLIKGQSAPSGVYTYTGNGLPAGVPAFNNNGYLVQYLTDYHAIDADLDSDGDQDILVSGYLTGQDFSIFVNDGAAAFTGIYNPFRQYSSQYTNENSYKKEVADVDGDGDLDVFSLDRNFSDYGRFWTIWTNEGSLSFLPLTAIQRSDYDMNDLVLADFDGDGDVDAVTISNFGNENQIFFNEENFPVTDLTLSNNTLSRRSAKGTLVGQLTATQADSDPITFEFVNSAGNGDDNGLFTISSTGELRVNADLTNVTKSALAIQIEARDGFGSNFTQSFNLTLEDLPQPRTNSSFTAKSVFVTNGFFENIQLDDLDGDSDIDIIAHKYDSIFTFLNDGVGNFTPRDSIAIGFSAYDISMIDVGDIDNDGDGDIIALNNTNNSDFSAVFTNNGSGFAGGPFGTTNIIGSKLADFDLDGDLDIFTFYNDGFGVASKIYYNVAGSWIGAFGDFNYESPQTVLKIDLVDFDKDSDLDVVYNGTDNFGNPLLKVFRTALGTIEGPPEFLRGQTTILNVGQVDDFEVADFDGDGFQDIITDDSVHLFNNALNAFQSTGQNVKVAAGLSAGSVTYDQIEIADYDGDNDVDAMLHDGSGNFFTLENDGTGSFSLASPQPIDLPSFVSQKILWEDLDNDNDLDAFIHNGGIGTADSIYFNTSPLTFVANTFTVPQGSSFVLAPAQLTATDEDTPPAQIIYTLSTIVANGNLELSGTPLTSGQTFTQADVIAGNVTYVHDGSNTLTDFFEFDVTDGFTNLVGQALNFTISGVPTESANNAITLNEGDTTLITNTDLSFSDSDNTEDQTTFSVSIPPVNGSLELVSDPGTAVTSFTQLDINNENVRYIHDGSETTSDSFSFEVSDGENITGPVVFSFVISPVNDAPEIVTNTGFSLLTNSSFTITTAELSGSDPDTEPTQLSYQITALPVNGDIELSSNPGIAIFDFTQADIENNLVVYNHSGFTSDNDSLTVTLTDGNITTPGAIINITVNTSEPPTFTSQSLNVDEGASAVLDSVALKTDDVDTDAASLTYTVSSPASFGTIENLAEPGTEITTFTQLEIDNEEIQYVHDGSENFADSIIFEITDGSNTITDQQLDISINPVNDNAPVVDAAAGPFIVIESAPIGTNIGAPIGFTDIDSLPETTYTYAIVEAGAPFDIDSSGQLSVSAPLDFLTQNEYSISVEVNDGVQSSASENFIVGVTKDQLRADSLALSIIYENTDGSNWTDNTGWTTTNVAAWSGVTVTGNAVTAIDLSGNNLSGTFDIPGNGLDSLISLNISQNELEGVSGIAGKPLITTVDISNNKLGFLDLSNVQTGTYELTLSPQQTVLNPIDTLLEIGGDPYVVDRSVPGGESYTWFDEGAPLTTQTDSAFTVSISSFADEAVYTAEVTSTLVPGLTLTTEPVTIKVSSLERDEAALRIVYEGLGLGDLTGATITEFGGVGFNSDETRVASLELSGTGASGALDPAIRDVASLETVDLSDNSITSLPLLTGRLQNVTSFNVSNNNLDFGDLEPNASFTALVAESMNPLVTVNMEASQTELDTAIDRGSNFTLAFDVGGSNNSNTWFFENVEGQEDSLQNAIESTYVIEDISIDNMGTYRLEVTSDVEPFTDLTLESVPLTVLGKTTVEIVPRVEGVGSVSTSDATIELYQLPDQGRFIQVDTIGAGRQNTSFTFEDVILGDNYTVIVRPEDTITSVDVNGSATEYELLPTWLGGDIDWNSDLLDTLVVFDPVVDTVDMVVNPAEADEGTTEFDMLVESDFAEEEDDARIEARRRVQKAGCSLRRRSRGGRTDQDDAFVLVAYKETDENGNVSFGNLVPGDYRLNIQYPGVPMDESSETEFVIEEGEQANFEASATITEEGISVAIEKVLSIIQKYFKDVSVYPNPANEFFTLKYKSLISENVSMKMVNISGQTMKSIEVNKGYDQEIKVNTRELNEGIYILYFYDRENPSKEILTFKVVVEH